MKSKNKLDIAYDYFEKNREALSKKYKNKFIVIKETTVVAVFSTFDAAYNYATKNVESGTFLIQKCEKKSISSMMVFNTVLVK